MLSNIKVICLELCFFLLGLEYLRDIAFTWIFSTQIKALSWYGRFMKTGSMKEQ